MYRFGIGGLDIQFLLSRIIISGPKIQAKTKASWLKKWRKMFKARAKFPNVSLADLYDPNIMPPELVKAQQALDKAVDLCYWPQPYRQLRFVII